MYNVDRPLHMRAQNRYLLQRLKKAKQPRRFPDLTKFDAKRLHLNEQLPVLPHVDDLVANKTLQKDAHQAHCTPAPGSSVSDSGSGSGPSGSGSSLDGKYCRVTFVS